MKVWAALLFCVGGIGVAGTAIAGDPYDYKKTVQRRVTPVSVSTNSVGRVLVDFGREAFGFLEFAPPAGTRGKYHVRLGELLRPDGSVNMKPGATIRAEEVESEIRDEGVHRVPLVPDKRNTTGGKEGGAVPIPPEHGVILPFRYAEFFSAPFPITKDTVRMVAINYPIDMEASAFACSDANLTKLYDFCKYSILATSFAGLYVDGDRERIPYEADAYLNQLGEYAVHADYSLGRASHEYLMKHPTWPTEWKQHSIKMAWADYMWSGDRRSLEKFYDQLRNEKLLLKFVRESDGLLLTGGERARGGLYNARGAADIVDWPPHERDGFVFKDVNAVINAFFYRNLLEMADIAQALDKSADAAQFRVQAKEVYAAYQKVFFDATRRVYVDGEGTDHASQHANAAALAFGLVPAEHRRSVAEYCLSRGMACSVYFAQYLLEALYEAGEPDAALKLMTAKGDRTWLDMLDQGATITMEAWSVKYKPNLDLNHAWGTPPLNVISRYLLGVTPLEPGFAKIRIRPQVGRLDWVKGTVPTAKGPVKVSVVEDVLTVETPAPARIEFNGEVRDVPAGRHVLGAQKVASPGFFTGAPVAGHVHASTLLPVDGGFLAAWFQGTREGAADVAIWGSRCRKGVWETPKCWAKVNPESPHWNPVQRRADDGRICLHFKVGRNCSDWRTYVQESHDEGRTWGAPFELVLGDVSGGRGPVKNKCLKLRDGRWLAPASTEIGAWRAFVDISDDDGRTWARSKTIPLPKVTKDFGVIQPTLWEDADGVIHALMRSNDRAIYASESTDRGVTWSLARAADLPGINSGIDLVRVRDGRVFLACNGGEGRSWGPRNVLRLLVSSDNGKTWSPYATLASDVRRQPDGRATEFSYPAILESVPGKLAVAFTWNRRQIRFCEFDIY